MTTTADRLEMDRLKTRIRILQDGITTTLRIPSHNGGATAGALQTEIDKMETALRKAMARLSKGRK